MRFRKEHRNERGAALKDDEDEVGVVGKGSGSVWLVVESQVDRATDDGTEVSEGEPESEVFAGFFGFRV